MGLLLAQLSNAIDCDEVLSLWICRGIFKKWESIEGGGVAGGGELLFTGVVLSAQQECDSQSVDLWGL